VVIRQPQVERRTGKVRLSETDVLPLCHTTSHVGLLQSTKSTDNTAIEPNQPISVQLFDWSTTPRKVAVIAAKTMSKSKTMLEMTTNGLGGH